MTTDDLLDLAHTLGVTVTTHHGGPKGWYEHHTKTISIRADLRAANQRCTLAHEIAHAIAGDTYTGITHFDQRMERAADMMAAQMLIANDTYARAEQLHGPHPGAIARELGVTVHIIETWQKMAERTPA